MINSRILIIGDIMLDEYWFGTSNRISPEVPVPIVDVQNKDFRVGGAGNVALNLFGINPNITLISCIGKDKDGKIIKKILRNKKIHFNLKEKSNCKTIKKLRIFSQNQQMIRLDFENDKRNYRLELNDKMKKEIRKSKLLILSDYQKGSLIDVKKIIDYAKSNSKVIIVDPKGSNFSKYAGATILTPNINEFINIVGEVNNQSQLIRKAKNLIKKIKLKGILITQGKKGMTFVSNKDVIYKNSLAQDVFDVSGAGDTVIAIFSAYLNAGKSYEEAMEMANIAASIVIKKLGTAIADKQEINKIYYKKNLVINKKYQKSISQILRITDFLKAQNKKIVFTNGCFDVIHLGHIHLLERAKEFGDFLIVAINSDKSARALKGKKRPINKISARVKTLESINYVDLVVVFNELTPLNIIQMIKPDVLVKGGDYKIKDIVGSDLVKLNGGKVKIVKTVQGYSTTKILQIQNS
jgi:D-beta-D-heptose 7-phosphate kinase/D-beta-D-heptose 1-phosphate adenosyltransferase